MNNEDIWKAKEITDLDVDDMGDSHLISVIEMFEKRSRTPKFLNELKSIATKRGIDLNNKYDKENKEKDNIKKKNLNVPERIAVLYDTDAKDKTLTERIITTGRPSLYDLFTKSNILTDKKLNHHPFIVFRDDGDTMSIVIVNNAKELEQFSNETKVMVQWKGKWNSDFFHFNIGDLKNFFKKENVTIDGLIVRKKNQEEEKKRLKEAKKFKKGDTIFFDDLNILGKNEY